MGCVYTTSSTHVTSSFLTDQCNPPLVICTTLCEPSTVQPVLLPSTSLISFPSTTPHPTSSSPNANNNPPLNATTIATATATPSASASHCCSYATCIINKRLLSLMGCVYTTSSTHVTSSFLTDQCNPPLVICTTLCEPSTVQPVLLPSTSLISFPSTTPRPTSSSPNANNNPPLNPNPNPNPNPDPDPILNATTIATATATPSASASHCCSYATCIINKRLLSLMGCVYTTSSTHVTSSFLTDRCNPLLVICTTFLGLSFPPSFGHCYLRHQKPTNLSEHSATSAPPSTSLISFPSTTPRPTSSSPNANNNPPLNPNPNPNPNPDPDPILNATTIATATATPSASASHCCSYATCIINKRLLSLMGCVYTTSSTHVTSSFLTDRCNPLLVICTTFTVQPVLLPSTSLISFPSTTPRPTSSSPNANNNPPLNPNPNPNPNPDPDPILNATTIATATATPSASASHCCSYATCIINKRLLSLMGCVYTTSSTHVTSSFLTDRCNPLLVICTTL
ncbi:hypothetical protein TcWFU_004040 [Taenia crassiceps]|uniref:Uncharacterized protein n=1 Tax=Taenia crassiceps TaxID=6207 RepID=A0ABR4PYZ3_9CEST